MASPEQIRTIAERMAPGLDWVAVGAAHALGDGAQFAGAAIELPNEVPATVTLAELGGEWMAELAVSRRQGAFLIGIRAQAAAPDARTAWSELLRTAGAAGGLEMALGLYAAEVASCPAA